MDVWMGATRSSLHLETIIALRSAHVSKNCYPIFVFPVTGLVMRGVPYPLPRAPPPTNEDLQNHITTLTKHCCSCSLRIGDCQLASWLAHWLAGCCLRLLTGWLAGWLLE